MVNKGFSAVSHVYCTGILSDSKFQFLSLKPSSLGVTSGQKSFSTLRLQRLNTLTSHLERETFKEKHLQESISLHANSHRACTHPWASSEHQTLLVCHVHSKIHVPVKPHTDLTCLAYSGNIYGIQTPPPSKGHTLLQASLNSRRSRTLLTPLLCPHSTT